MPNHTARRPVVGGPSVQTAVNRICPLPSPLPPKKGPMAPRSDKQPSAKHALQGSHRSQTHTESLLTSTITHTTPFLSSFPSSPLAHYPAINCLAHSHDCPVHCTVRHITSPANRSPPTPHCPLFPTGNRKHHPPSRHTCHPHHFAHISHASPSIVESAGTARAHPASSLQRKRPPRICNLCIHLSTYRHAIFPSHRDNPPKASLRPSFGPLGRANHSHAAGPRRRGHGKACPGHYGVPMSQACGLRSVRASAGRTEETEGSAPGRSAVHVAFRHFTQWSNQLRRRQQVPRPPGHDFGFGRAWCRQAVEAPALALPFRGSYDSIPPRDTGRTRSTLAAP
jgi:hypothetical protein